MYRKKSDHHCICYSHGRNTGYIGLTYNGVQFLVGVVMDNIHVRVLRYTLSMVW